MTILKPWRRKGSFIPFPLPVNVDDIAINDIDAEPLRRLCFNEGYEPLIRGALKALTREETYMGEQEVIDNLVQQADHLQNMFADGCVDSGIAPVTWDFHRVAGNVAWEYQRYFNDLDGTPHALYVAYTGFCQLVGRQVPNNSLWAGGKFDQYEFFASSSGADCELIGHDCLGNFYSAGFLGHVSLADIGPTFAFKDLTIISDAGGLLFAVSASEPDCEEV